MTGRRSMTTRAAQNTTENRGKEGYEVEMTTALEMSRSSSWKNSTREEETSRAQSGRRTPGTRPLLKSAVVQLFGRRSGAAALVRFGDSVFPLVPSVGASFLFDDFDDFDDFDIQRFCTRRNETFTNHFSSTLLYTPLLYPLIPASYLRTLYTTPPPANLAIHTQSPPPPHHVVPSFLLRLHALPPLSTTLPSIPSHNKPIATI